MLTEILLCICAVVCLYLSYRYAVGRPEGFPPGEYARVRVCVLFLCRILIKWIISIILCAWILIAGPPRIPFFGSYLFMMLANAKYLHKGVLKFSKWYKSDIVGFHMGSFPVVAVHNVEGVREVLNRKEFDGRAQVFLGTMRTPSKEILGNFSLVNFILRLLRFFKIKCLSIANMVSFTYGQVITLSSQVSTDCRKALENSVL